MANNLFEMLTKWQLRDHGDPLENRLTAALVATANNYPPLLAGLAGLADLRCSPDEPATMRMHPPAFDKRGNYRGAVDAELRFSKTVIWWEAKVESGLSGDRQLKTYLECLPRVERRALVLLAPARRRREFAKALVGDDRLRFVAWEQVLATIEHVVAEAPPENQGLLKEALDFFAMNGFKPTATLTVDLVDILHRAGDALAAVDAVLAVAGDQIDEQYGTPVTVTDDHRQHRPSATGKTSGWGNSARLVWEFDPESVCLWAGLLFDPTARRFGTAEMLGWRASLSEQDGWEEEPDRRTEWYLGVYRDLRHFAGEGDTEQQGRRVAEWIDQVFDCLVRTRP